MPVRPSSSPVKRRATGSTKSSCSSDEFFDRPVAHARAERAFRPGPCAERNEDRKQLRLRWNQDDLNTSSQHLVFQSGAEQLTDLPADPAAENCYSPPNRQPGKPASSGRRKPLPASRVRRNATASSRYRQSGGTAVRQKALPVSAYQNDPSRRLSAVATGLARSSAAPAARMKERILQ